MPKKGAMLTLTNHQPNPVPEVNFREKIRCGEIYRNLNGNEMFQKFYYRCLECSMDFESSPEFEEHVICHYLQDDNESAVVSSADSTANHNVIDISSEEEDNDYLYAVEVASLVEGNVSENDLPLPLMQMLSETSADSTDQVLNFDSEDEYEKNIAFPCDGLRRQALHQYSEPEKCCTRCPAYFNTKSDLNFHLHIHTLPNTVTCPHCYEVYANTVQMNEHIWVRRKKPRKNTKTNDCDDENLNSHARKKAKNQSSTANQPQSTTTSIETINSTKADTKCQTNSLKENVNATGKNTTNSHTNANAKRKEAENIERNSATNSSTTLLELNQTEHSNSAIAIKDI